VSAKHVASFNAVVLTGSGGVLAGTGASVTNNVAATVQAAVGNDVVVKADDILMEATNEISKPQLSNDNDNIKGTTGGVISGAGVSSTTWLSLQTTVEVGNRAKMDLMGSIAHAREFRLSALNKLNTYEKVTFRTFGALAGGGADTELKTVQDLAQVLIGEQAELKSPGTIRLSARGQGTVTVKTSTETAGLASVGVGDASVELNLSTQFMSRRGSRFQPGAISTCSPEPTQTLSETNIPLRCGPTRFRAPPFPPTG